MRYPITFLISVLSYAALFAQPVNDEPCSALPLTVQEDCAFITVDNVDGTLTDGVPTPGCGNPMLSDVWYVLTVPPTGLLILNTVAGTITDAAMAVYSAPSCSGPFTLIQCDDDQGPGFMPEMVFNDLEPGGTLYVRAWSLGGITGTFQFCAHAPIDPGGDDCTYLLEMIDGSGNGWGDGAHVDLSINGTPLFIDNLEQGTLDMHLFGVHLGDVVVLQYTGGLFNGENGVRLLLLGTSTPLLDLPEDPDNGVIYSAIADCLALPPSPGDCPYATPLCHDTTFMSGAMTIGYVADLDPSNSGCLASGEREGIWTQFTVAATGSVAFTLDPQTPTDFDFAIWGPLDSITCPPSGPPVRCSYAGISSAIGLSVTALDNSEGAGGDGWVKALDVMPGQRYLLYIDNFSTNNVGLDLTWQFTGGASLTCPDPPVVDFGVSSALIFAGELVDFTDLSSNSPTSWSWSFPDGTPSSSELQNPTGITYFTPGCHDVTLVASNPGGSGAATHACAVEVEASTGIGSSTSPISFVQEADGITVRNANNGTMEVTLFDAMGRTLQRAQGTTPVHLCWTSIASGQYILAVRSEQTIRTRNVLITH